MKFYIFAVFLLALVCSHARVLPKTPKGDGLQNHYGTHVENDYYGPKTQRKSTLWTNNAKKVYLRGSDSKCDAENTPHYPLCTSLTSCDLCAAKKECGWCETTQKCAPATDVCQKTCPTQWFYSPRSCGKELITGSFTNVAPESTKLIDAEIADPKAKVSRDTREEALLKTDKQVGWAFGKKKVTALHKPTGKIVEDVIPVAEPLMTQVHQPVDIVKHQTTTINLKDGTEDEDTFSTIHAFESTKCEDPEHDHDDLRPLAECPCDHTVDSDDGAVTVDEEGNDEVVADVEIAGEGVVADSDVETEVAEEEAQEGTETVEVETVDEAEQTEAEVAEETEQETTEETKQEEVAQETSEETKQEEAAQETSEETAEEGDKDEETEA
eukprot:CAMPEP_0114999858 /NCGR_PEP_ID=MMETSP0216-20121206/16401_1 /TAXON_ID=223996 /ORGANISM="Protocruzia adherens, Strain Boccale" /LENGTH=382 /DNA_ID=CAMNT_0002364823 /DNA_START=29 /DNA_END=1177 /DNA_ORIENTATION=+